MQQPLFDNARKAIYWAEEAAQRPDVDSQLTKFHVKGGSGDMTPDEIRDVALTITGIVTNYEKPKGLAFTAVYGHPNIFLVMSLGDMIAEQLSVMEEAKNKQFASLRGLVCGVIESEYRRWHFGRNLSQAGLASKAGMTRQSFAKSGWPELQIAARQILHDWLEQAERGITDQLGDRGWLS